MYLQLQLVEENKCTKNNTPKVEENSVKNAKKDLTIFYAYVILEKRVEDARSFFCA